MQIATLGIDARSFLGRARQRLAEFDLGKREALFYAALDLRFGIEARLFTYIDAAPQAQGDRGTFSREYVASKLLAHLTRLAPDAARGSVLRVRHEGSGEVSGFVYTPVTPRLAKMHGQLGELLHAKFFRNNPAWCINREFDVDRPQTLLDYRSFLGEVVAELTEATRGTLLGNPVFTKLVEEVLSPTTPHLGDGSRGVEAPDRHS